MPKHISLEGTFLNSNHNIENYHLKMWGIMRVAIIRDLVNKSCFPKDTLSSGQQMLLPELGFLCVIYWNCWEQYVEMPESSHMCHDGDPDNSPYGLPLGMPWTYTKMLGVARFHWNFIPLSCGHQLFCGFLLYFLCLRVSYEYCSE